MLFGINVSYGDAVIEFALLVLYLVILWGLYKHDQYREKKRVEEERRKFEMIEI